MLLVKQSRSSTAPTQLSFREHLADREPDREGNYQRDSFAAYVLNVASSWAYSDADTMADIMGRLGFPYCRQITLANDAMLIQANAFFLLSEDGRQGILCFRGTEPRNVINWLTDASVRVEPVPGMGRVHGGFYRNVVFIWNRIEEALQQALDGFTPHDGGAEERLPPLENLYICGHSLGAAMAVVAAARIFGSEKYREWKRRVRGVYTYGQPIVGDREFARVCGHRFGRMLFRHVYKHDLVPRLPPTTTGPFVHFGEEYRGSDDGWEPSNTAVRQVRSVMLSAGIGVLAWVFRQLRPVGRVQLPFSIDDHSPNNYLHASRVEIGSEWFSDLALGVPVELPIEHRPTGPGLAAH
jgi:Lipase (class 3)